MTEAGGWTPDKDTVENANLTRFLAWLADTGRGEFADYHQLWAESVREVEWFWDAVWQFFGVRATTHADTVLANREMPGAQWFPGSTLNYVSEVFRHESDGRPALIVAGEDGSAEWSWERLRHETAAFANYLRRLGVKPGDRVVGYLPNVGEAVVAFLAAASVGATWAVCNQDLAVSGVVARLGQLEPTVLVATDGSVYGGKRTRPAHRTRRDPAPAADPEGHRRGAPAGAGGRRRCGPMVAGARNRRAAGDHAGPVRPSAVGAVLVGHHRHAEGHRARPRRRGARAPQVPEPAPGPQARRPVLLAVLHQLDDVEPAGVGPAGRFDGGALRRQPDLPAHRRSVAGGRRPPRHGVRFGCGLPVGVRQGGTAPRQGLPAGRAARGRRHRFAVARLGFSLDSGRCRPADPGGVGQRRHRRGDGVHRGMPTGADRGRRAELHLSGRGRGSVVRRGPPGDRAGRRTGAHPADAVDAGVLLERPRRQPLPQGVLRQVPRGVVSRRLAHHHRAGFGCGAWPFGRHPEPDGRADGQRRDLQRGRNTARDP